MLRTFLFCLCLALSFSLFPFSSLAQDSKIDSLENLLTEESQDTVTVKVLNELSKAFENEDPVRALDYNTKALALAISLDYKPGLAVSYQELGIIQQHEGNFDGALGNFLSALSIYESIKDSTGIALCLNNVGTVHFYQKNYDKTLDYWGQSLTMHQKLSNLKEIARMFNNIGVAHEKKGDPEKALEFHKQSLASRTEMEDERGVAQSNQNIAIIYAMREDFEEAITFFKQSLDMRRELGNKRDIAQTVGNVGQLYLEWAVAQKKEGLSSSSFNSRLAKAKAYIEEGLSLALELKAMNTVKYGYKNLSEIYEHKRNTDEALRYYKLYSELKDSLFTVQSSSRISEMEANYQVEKEKREVEIAEAERKRLEAEQVEIEAKETERRNLLQYSGAMIIIVALFITILFSARLSIPVRFAEAGVFFTFLLLFEFILVLSDPYIEEWTGGEPGIKLMVNASLAALIFPLHSLAEGKLKIRLIKTKKELARKKRAAAQQSG